MEHQQRIYLSINKARYAVQNKSELDCLAFCIMGKLMFGCSILVKTSIREYKKMFRMGSTRLTRIMKDCLRLGYIKDCGTHYFFNPIKDAKAQNALVILPRVWGKGPNKCTAVTLNQIKDYIRKVVQYDKFDKKEAIENALEAKANAKTLKRLRKAHRLCSRISNNPSLSGELRGTSMGRIASNMVTYKAKARKLIREMVADGWIANRSVTIKTNFSLSQFSERALLMLREMGWHGSYFRLGHDIFCRVSNIYKLCETSLLSYRRSM